MLKGKKVKMAMCAVATVAAVAVISLTGCGGSGGGAASQSGGQGDQGGGQGAQGGEPAAQQEAAGIGLRDACYMWDQELIEALEAEGYQVKESNSESVTYAKDGTEVLISEAGGYRIFSSMGDESKDLYEYMASNVPDIANQGEYSKGDSFFVVATGTVAHEDGVVVGNNSTVFIVESGNFQQLKGLVSGANINSGMSAQAAAANLVLGLNDAGFELSRGGGIDLGFAEATTDASNYAEEDVQVGGGSGGSGATTDQGQQLYQGQWRDPDYGDTLTFNSDGTLTIKQSGEGTTTWWWSETSNGIHIENAANSYDLTLAGNAKTYFLYNDDKGLYFEKM